MAVMPVCKLPGLEVLLLSYSSMLHAYSMVIHILTELMAVWWGGDWGKSLKCTLSAASRAHSRASIRANACKRQHGTDNQRQKLHDNCAIEIRYFLIFFPPGPKGTQNWVTD